MNDYAQKTDTRLTAKDIKELGLEEAPHDIGPSLEQERRQGGDSDEQ